MWGKKQRRIAELGRKLADRGEQVTEANDRVRTIGDEKRRLRGRHDDLMNLVAIHVTNRTSHDRLVEAVVRAGLRADLEYALLVIPPNTRPATTEEVTPA